MRWLILGLLVVSLSACGFHLRGTGQVAQAWKITEVSDGAEDFSAALMRLMPDTEPVGEVAIRSFKFSRRSLGKTAGGSQRVYEARLTLVAEASGREENLVLQTQREFSADEDNPSAADFEWRALQKVLERELAGTLLRALR